MSTYSSTGLGRREATGKGDQPDDSAPSFQVSEVQAVLEPYGITDRQMIAESLETLDLYSLIERRGQRYHFRLAEFPRIAREFEGIDVRIQSALSDFERHGHGSNRRPS